MDCHNRPSHVFLPPGIAVDRAMEGGSIPADLPWIKKLAVDALTKDYHGEKNIHGAIREYIGGYYAKHHPRIEDARAAIDKAIEGVTTIYDQNVFPQMNVSWTTYPNYIGHRNWPGCFRCHDNLHRTASGKTLISSCSVCHTEPQRGPLLPLGSATSLTSKEPWHPFPLKGEHGRALCNLCHRAGYRLPTSCISCHKLSDSAPMMSSGCATCHLKEGEVKPLAKCSSCHRHLGGLHKKGAHADTACTTCHTAHTWRVTTRQTCLSCHDDRRAHYAPTFCGECHEFGDSHAAGRRARVPHAINPNHAGAA